jgi:large conductance mechanosensitive channel
LEAAVLKEFQKFLMRGNLVDLAIAVIIGTAFGAVVKAFTTIIFDIISAVGGQPSFDGLTIHVGSKGRIHYGQFLTALTSFIIVALVCFFIIKGYEALNARRKAGAAADAPEIPDDIVLLTEIRDLLAKQ